MLHEHKVKRLERVCDMWSYYEKDIHVMCTLKLAEIKTAASINPKLNILRRAVLPSLQNEVVLQEGHFQIQVLQFE